MPIKCDLCGRFVSYENVKHIANNWDGYSWEPPEDTLCCSKCYAKETSLTLTQNKSECVEVLK